MTRMVVYYEKYVTPADEAVLCTKADAMNGKAYVTVDRENKVVSFEYDVPNAGVSEAYFLMGVVGALMGDFHIKKFRVSYEEGC